MTDYTLDQFVDDMRRICASGKRQGEVLRDLRPLALELAKAKEDWLKPEHYNCSEEQGFGLTLLHEEPDHSLAVFAVSWLPGRGTPAHNHGSWAIVAGVDGFERNVYYKRLDDGSRPDYAELEQRGEEKIGSGQAGAFPDHVIHSVHNDSDRVTLSLHIYGKHLNHAGRSQFDPATNTETPLIVEIQEAC